MDTKTVLGLDLGTTSIGWALVKEAQNPNGQSEIIRTGVRVVPLSTDEETDFQKGKSISINADRTLKRGARRNLQRYKQRRDQLIEILGEAGFIHPDTALAEDGKNTTHTTWKLRATAATGKIPLEDLARVFLAINKKRGYKSNRKAKDEGDGQAIDGIAVAMTLYEHDQTPAQYSVQRLSEGNKTLPDFYRSDLQREFDKIWNRQQSFYPGLLTPELKTELTDKNKKATWAICSQPFAITGKIQKGSAAEKRREILNWRVLGLTDQLDLEQLALVLSDINGQIQNSSGYLGAISDRSKQLIIQKLTVGQFLYGQLCKNPHTRLKNQVFYRQDYLDEFEKIWETQSKYHPQLTHELKEELRDVVIFYQRKLKSQKGLISFCEFEQKQVVVKINGTPKTKIRGLRVCPRASPLFQEFKIWQILNNLELKCTLPTEANGADLPEEKSTDLKYAGKCWVLNAEQKKRLFQELNIKETLSTSQILKLLGLKNGEWELNYKTGIEGNRTQAALYGACAEIVALSGHEPVNLKSGSATQIHDTITEVFDALEINTKILSFDSALKGDAFEKQPAYRFWHLLYSYEGDNSRTGNDKLLEKLHTNFGFAPEYARVLLKVSFSDEYGSLSTKAMRRILPHLREGHPYDIACTYAGYNHSHAITAEENLQRELKTRLEILPKNSLRNPVVEKILNQMVHVVNQIMDTYGRPDEIRVELARELKNSAKERDNMTSGIRKAAKEYEAYREEIKNLYPFNTGIRITRKDLIKYKLYQELSGNGFRTLYTNTYIPREKLFSKEFDIEHIIPQAKLFDDSFSNKTLSLRQVNLDKKNDTAYDFLASKYGPESEAFADYLARVEKSFRDQAISKSKYKKLLMTEAEIPDGFIERDMRNTQYIAKKAVQMLREVVRTVTPTTGKVTAKLREDWELVNVLQDINLDKYKKLGLVKYEKSKDGKNVPRIEGWTKRNDHRHHAMDAIAVAFTRPSHIQYLNYLNARKDEKHQKHANIYAIEQKETMVDEKRKRRFVPPMAIETLRSEAKKHLEQTLVSFKAKNKVVTRNKNRIKKKKGESGKIELTPRGQLHKEMVYGKKKRYATKLEKVGPKFDAGKIGMVAEKSHREALLKRLQEFDGDPKKAFGGKNAPAKNPVYLDRHQSITLPEKVKLVWMEDHFTIRKTIDPELKLEKVIDKGVKRKLQERLAEFNGDAKKAFSNLDENPIWQNKNKGIQLRRVAITGVTNAEPLHEKKDHLGYLIKDANGNPIPVDYVSTGNNHHVAIYEDGSGKQFDFSVSFSDAVKRRAYNLPVIPKDTDLLWEKVVNQGIDDQAFLATLPPQGLKLYLSMKQNEYFVFPNEGTGFDPSQIDLLRPDHYDLISPNLFRGQKFSKLQYGNSAVREYVFRHHLDTTVDEIKELKDISYKNIKSIGHLQGMVKVRINHIGQIVHVGEY